MSYKAREFFKRAGVITRFKPHKEVSKKFSYTLITRMLY